MTDTAERRYQEALAAQREQVERLHHDLGKADELLASMQTDKPRWLSFYGDRPVDRHHQRVVERALYGEVIGDDIPF